ncbi:nuclear transport factor 2 family protein, partial [Fulvivirga aurantia]|uniref:nuclear transport factor 2 family protein n=1 Tax=Fulvivirga aurantia TaxID=2529383 RepID=UPI001FE26E97
MVIRLKLLLLFLVLHGFVMAQETTPEALAQQQLDAYNARDIEAFLIPYSDSVKIYNFPGELSMQGKDAMRTTYSGMFERLPDLHCTIVNRMVNGNVVIDHESVVFRENMPAVEVFALYKISNG